MIASVWQVGDPSIVAELVSHGHTVASVRETPRLLVHLDLRNCGCCSPEPRRDHPERMTPSPALLDLHLTQAIPQPIWHPISYRTWAPPASPVLVEYSLEMLRNIRGTGVLFGVRQRNRLRIVAAETGGGLDPVGIFVVRSRGEVFLTEADLERFEDFQVPGAVALVVAGGKAGFFVREAGGAIQAVQSYEEFLAADSVAAKPPRFNFNFRPLWLWYAVGALALLTTLAALRPSEPVHAPFELQVRAEEGQLLITWNRDIEIGALEIKDGGQISKVPVPKGLAQVTYQPVTGDVEVRLEALDWQGQHRRGIARFLGPEPLAFEATPGP